MKWETKPLRELCTVITKGTTPSNIGESFTDSGVRYIRSEMITSSKYVSGDFLFISLETHEKLKRSQLQEGDILFSMAGVYLGKTAILRNNDVPSNTNQAVAIIRIDTSKCNRDYVYYYLNIPRVIKQVNTLTSQSAQPNINLTQIGQLLIPLPDRETQEKIARNLSLYDALIENNQKQIKLLEEAAQRLYKEWFVDLRFPGYEKARIVDGMPEGWHWGTLSEIAEFKRGKTIVKSEVKEGTVPVVAGGLEPAYYHNQANTTAPVITVSGSGANAGFTRMYYEDVFASDCSFIDSKGTDDIYFVYYFLKENKQVIDSMQKGAAQPHVYAKDINALPMLVPDRYVLIEYTSLIESVFLRIATIEKQTSQLSKAQNYLLIRLFR